MSALWSFVVSVLQFAVNMINGASVWMIFSFIVVGIVHEIFDAVKMRNSPVCSNRISGVLYSTVSGLLIPICSCGSVPLSIGLYYSGAYLGPTLAFLTSSPMINPISLILAYGLLGKEIATIYLITGFLAPIIIGTTANRFAGPELHRPESGETEDAVQVMIEKPTLLKRLKNGFQWSFGELAIMVSKYTVTGMLLASLLLSIVPQVFIQRYLGNPGFVSIFGILIIAVLMYVCAVGHMPFIAAIVASGAAPGVAITFLMAGAATNFSELITINRTIGKRSMLMYVSMVVIISIFVGYLTNQILPNFKPALNYDVASQSITTANRLLFSAPLWLKYICSAAMVCFAVIALVKSIRKKLA